MTVRIEKPAINVREELADLRKPSGVAGEAMLRAETPQEQFNLIGAGRRNLIINGDMRIAQRGTSQAGVTSISGYGTCDRWHAQMNSSGTFTLSQSTAAPEGFSNSFKVECTTADASPNYLLVGQRLEGQNLQHIKKGLASAESLTVSFWVRSSKVGTYQFNLRDLDNSRAIGATYAVSSANTWEYKSLTFVGDTSGALDNDNANSLTVEWWLGAGASWNSGAVPSSWQATSNADRAAGLTVNIGTSTSDDFYITGVQLEVGKVATPFEHRSYGEELALCQRYYQNYGLTSADRIYTFQYNVSYKGLQYSYFCPMRAVPTITRTNGGNTITLGSITNQKFFGYVASGASDATPHYLHTVSFDAEL